MNGNTKGGKDHSVPCARGGTYARALVDFVPSGFVVDVLDDLLTTER